MVPILCCSDSSWYLQIGFPGPESGPSREIQESGAEKPELSHEVQWPGREKTGRVVKRPDRQRNGHEGTGIGTEEPERGGAWPGNGKRRPCFAGIDLR